MREEIVPIKKRHSEEPEPETSMPEPEAEVKPEAQKTSVHIMLDSELLENVKEMADYAAAAGLIHYDPRGNVTDFINWCIMVGKDKLREYALKRRKFI